MVDQAIYKERNYESWTTEEKRKETSISLRQFKKKTPQKTTAFINNNQLPKNYNNRGINNACSQPKPTNLNYGKKKDNDLFFFTNEKKKPKTS